ncbi:hypothetical protein XELAEV_18041239mg [Xenopus laevis]|uniref:Uncharacterized protein n=1 Tax=Xenopus laevis TaxID=8355 RepID=A0A974H4V4_XENLA|nr:hypothetical protein XELAEV_18041239mg [Xenopus laevis]
MFYHDSIPLRNGLAVMRLGPFGNLPIAFSCFITRNCPSFQSFPFHTFQHILIGVCLENRLRCVCETISLVNIQLVNTLLL